LRLSARFDTLASVTPPDRLRPIVATGIFFFTGDVMKPYTKVPQSNTDLAILLQNRGLVANSTKLLRILETVGYYRFTGYLHPFRMPNSDAYRPNTTLETVWDIYMFDRHLRLMAMDALARIEIAVRAITRLSTFV
jgi:abortive infection bacteriophage resistance protein